ncbi:MAG: FAD-dependent oxidoreductase, partial [Candidatus Eremiobacteraeota bacterium]|nr:FAD-dependent oxidoreductase [Candidatus Eremiobacteraeota bacterium]
MRPRRGSACARAVRAPRDAIELVLSADVIVIGAGAAGLAAARDLARQSLHVVVLEGRDRIGGRVCSQSPEPDLPLAELGAEFVHGSAAQTMALLHETGQGTLPLSGDFFALDREGRLQRDDH